MTRYEPPGRPLVGGASLPAAGAVVAVWWSKVEVQAAPRGVRLSRTFGQAMTDAAGGMAVTVRRDRRSPDRWAVYGPTTRRIGEVRPVGGSTACWWAVSRDGGIQGRGSTFGASVGLLVDAELEARNGA